ncbi:ComF family protein [Candidatus Saccharibacteria bacterium]|nr:ComF family protein [Candidatus Saccharibacteria bacterium]
MKKSVVKKSILERLLNIILPFYCRGCGRAGDLLCESCRNNINVVGEVAVAGGRMVDRLFVVGRREGALKKLVEDYKFKSIKRVAEILAELFDEALPEGLGDTGDKSAEVAGQKDADAIEAVDRGGEVVVVPLPTIRKHIRERGFDHTLRLAEELARRRNFVMSPMLKRINKTIQVGADEETRKKQAEKAYAVDFEVARAAGLVRWVPSGAGEELEDERLRDVVYLLLDDVWTTGASMQAAAKQLRAAGAKQILGAVVCKSS